MRAPGRARVLIAIHEQTALAGLVAIAVHGITLLGDPWLNPGIAGITVPFAMGFRPLLTGLGIVAGYLAAPLGLSFYFRRRIGARLWRKAHRATVVVYVLGLVHTLGAGTDASSAVVALVGDGDRAADRRPLRCPDDAAAATAHEGPDRGSGARRPSRGSPESAPHRRGLGERRMSAGVVIVGGGLAAQRCAETLAPARLRGPGPDGLRRARAAL